MYVSCNVSWSYRFWIWTSTRICKMIIFIIAFTALVTFVTFDNSKVPEKTTKELVENGTANRNK